MTRLSLPVASCRSPVARLLFALSAAVILIVSGLAENTARAEGAGAVPRVELITMGRGSLLFEKFGHAALCLVYDQGKRRTICYNYGTTDFERFTSLIWGFLRGRSLFWVSTSTRGRMIAQYRAADRTIWRQILPLKPEQAVEFERLLDENARGENRYYRYHHYRDNCSTRVRDIIDRVTGGVLSAPVSSPSLHPTLRELTRQGFAGDTGLLLLSDLLLSRAVDRRISTFEAMFLPEVMLAEVEARMGARPVVLHERRGPDFPADPGMGGRWLWVLLALAFAAPIAAVRRGERRERPSPDPVAAAPNRRRERLALAAGAVPLALLGLLVWSLAAVSDLPELRWNEVLLVFLPTDAALLFLAPLWRARYAAVRSALLLVVALLLAVGVLRQPLWLLIPMPLLFMIVLALPRRSAAPNADVDVAADVDEKTS